MPERLRTSGTEDINEVASRVVGNLASEKHNDSQKDSSRQDSDEKDPLAVELGRRGGLKGGPARAKKLSSERRKEIAKKAAKARWSKKSTT